MSPLDQRSKAAPALSVRGSVTPRAIVIALILIPANAYWVIQMELFRYSAHPTTVSLFFNVVFTLLVVQVGNVAMARVSPRLALGRGELMLIYSMVAVGSAIASHDFMQVLACYPTISFYRASPVNKWDTLINERLPTWITVQDPAVYRGYYLGGKSILDPQILLAWAPTLLMWTAFIMALLLVMASLTALIRRQWLDHEHLACPLVRLPLEVTHPTGRLWRSRVFWIGFALAAFCDTWNSIRIHYPVLPEIPIQHFDMGQYITGMPWKAVGWFPRSFYPFVIGLGYMMPTDFLFSCWFFYLFWKAEMVASAALGLRQIKDFPFADFQFFGAYMLFGVSSLWTARRYIRQIWATLMRRPTALDATREPVGYDAAVVGLLVGFIGLVVFSVALGLHVAWAVVYFLIYFVVALAITRMRAQFGAPVHDLHHIGAGRILTASLGTRVFSPQELIVLGVYYWFNRAYRGHPMPIHLEALKLQEECRRPARGLLPWLLAAGFVGIVASWWTLLGTNYSIGADLKGWPGVGSGEGFKDIERWMQNPSGLQLGPVLAMVVGFMVAFGLEALRFRFVTWPLHPLGFAIAGGWEMNLVWMPLFVAWIAKTTVVRYGGHTLYQALMPLFLGLILGQFVVGSLVNIISISLHVPSYMFWQ